jgi:hypothetical protein
LYLRGHPTQRRPRALFLQIRINSNVHVGCNITSHVYSKHAHSTVWTRPARREMKRFSSAIRNGEISWKREKEDKS